MPRRRLAKGTRNGAANLADHLVARPGSFHRNVPGRCRPGKTSGGYEVSTLSVQGGRACNPNRGRCDNGRQNGCVPAAGDLARNDCAGTVVLPNGWSLKPAGRQFRLGDLPVQIAVHPSEPVLAILHAGYGEHEIVTVHASSGKVIGRVALPVSFSGLTWSPDGKRLFAGGGFDDKIYRFDCSEGLLSKKVVFSYPEGRTFPVAPGSQNGAASGRYRRVPAGLAITKDGKTLYVTAAFGHSLARFDAETGALQAEIPLKIDSYPYGLALDETRKRLYVSLWTRARVAVVNTETFGVIDQWTTEDHPNEMLLAHGGKILFVANANRNTVTVIDTEAGKAIETIGTAIDPKAPPGSTPSSMALTPDESILFVANANTNDLAVVNVKDPAGTAPLGFIPTGWYPTSVRLSRDGKTVFVANGKGGSSRANRDGPRPGFPGGRNTINEYIGGLFQGTLSLISMPAPRQMALYSQTVYECSPLKRGDPTAVRGAAPLPGTRSRPRPASRRRSATSFTSSRRIEHTTRSSAISRKATVTLTSAFSPTPSLPTITRWCVSSSCSTTSTSTAK